MYVKPSREKKIIFRGFTEYKFESVVIYMCAGYRYRGKSEDIPFQRGGGLIYIYAYLYFNHTTSSVMEGVWYVFIVVTVVGLV
jgi:hypothetical protein